MYYYLFVRLGFLFVYCNHYCLQNLFKLHRDWYFHVPGRPRQVGRNQMVLDLSRKDVRDYLFVTIGDILCRSEDYLVDDNAVCLTIPFDLISSCGTPQREY